MRLHPSPEQQARRRKIVHRLWWCNIIFCITNLTIAFTFGYIPCFFAGGLCGAVALAMWDHP